MSERSRLGRLAARLALAAVIALLFASSARAQSACSVPWEVQVIDLINRERSNAGLPPYAMDIRLVESARLHSQDMAVNAYFSHTGLDGSTFAEREQRAGYTSPGGENIAAGYPTPEAAVAGWMASSGHRALILHTTMTHIGLGYAAGGPYGHYWTANFGRATSLAQVGVCAGAPGAPRIASQP
jgi:uncharacterized protein YkwD